MAAGSTSNDPPTIRPVDLARVEGSGGVVWSISPGGFHANLVVLDAGEGIAAHRNDSVDVLVIVVAGEGTVTADGNSVPVAAGTALLVPRRATRSVSAGTEELRYLTVHAERGPLTIGGPADVDV
jgi:quercetin dioxygenase-like cupin family protein